MKKSERLISLLIILSFALLIAFLMGQNDKIPWKKTLGYHLYSVFKQGLIECQFFIAKSLEGLLQTIEKLLDNASKITRLKSDG